MAQLKSTSVTGNLSVTGNILASKIIKLGGTADDILMGDGSITSKQGLIDSLEAAMEGNSWRPVKYGSTTVNDTSTTLEFIAGSNIGLTFTSGKLTIANNYSYSLPLAANGTRGGIQIGYTASGANLPVQLSSEKAYVALTKAAVESVVTIPTVNDGTLTLKASDGATATQQIFTANDADSVTFEVKHAVPSGAAEGNYGPSDGDEQEAKGTLDIIVPQITTDKFGHVTAVSNKTFKVTDTDTDTKVTQTVTTSSNTSKRPILLGYSYSDAATPSFSTVTNTTYASHNIYVAPKEGFLYANKFIGTSTSVSWYQGRESAAFRDIGSNGYHAALSLKTTNGSWEFGTYNSTNYHDVPLLTYITDTNYNNKNNSTTYQIKFPLKSGTIALTNDLNNFITSIPDIAITDNDDATTKKIVGDITASGHTITVSRIGLNDLGLASAYKYQGSLANLAAIEAVSNPVSGDVYNAQDTGMNYAWNGSAWDALGWIVDTSNFVTLNGVQTISGVKTFTAQPVINTSNGLKFDNGNCKLRIYNASASPTDYAAIEVRSNSSSTNRNLFLDLDNNSLVVGAVSGTADATYKVNVKDTFNATTIYENGKSIATQEWVTTQLGSGGSMDLSQYLPLAGNTTSTLMTGSIKYGGATREIISLAPEYQNGSWQGGMKYSWDSKTTIALWGANKDCQFVWHAGANLSTGSTDGWTNRNYDFQIGRNSSNVLEVLLGGKPLATQEWVADEIPPVNNGKLTLNTSGKGISGGKTTFTANQSGAATFTVTLDSSPEGNRGAEKVVVSSAQGTIKSAKYTITKTDGLAKASWQYNDSTDCVELVW